MFYKLGNRKASILYQHIIFVKIEIELKASLHVVH